MRRSRRSSAAQGLSPELEPRPPSTGPTNPAVARLIAQATAKYADAQAALRAGDLATFAQDIQELGTILTQIQAAVGTTP